MYISVGDSKEKCKPSQCGVQKQTNEECIQLLKQLNGETMIQAVVMSELLGKPKAKRRRRGW